MGRKCQRLLTVGKWVGGGVLERLERRVLFEAGRKVLGSLGIEVVAAQTANKDGIWVSGAADSRTLGVRRRT